MKVVFGEPDKMFRLTAGALSPALVDDQFIASFFLTEAGEPGFFGRMWTDRRAILHDLRVAIASDEAEFAHEIEDADVVVLEKQRLTAELVSRGRSLKLVLLFGRETGGLDMAACARAGVTVTAIDRYSNHLVAEHTLMLMLALTRNFSGAQRAIGGKSTLAPSGWAYNWPAVQGVRGLYGRTVGLVGLGEVGQLVAEYLQPFGVNLIYTRRSRDLRPEARLGLKYVDLKTLLATADVVSLHTPGGASIPPVLDADLLGDIKPGALIVNTARGAVIDEVALAAGLASGRIGGAALDVFSIEPLPFDHPFRALPNVILTPHIGAGSRTIDWVERDIGPVVDAIVDLRQRMSETGPGRGTSHR